MKKIRVQIGSQMFKLVLDKNLYTGKELTEYLDKYDVKLIELE